MSFQDQVLHFRHDELDSTLKTCFKLNDSVKLLQIFSPDRFKGKAVFDKTPKVEILYQIMNGQPHLKLGIHFQKQYLYSIANMIYGNEQIKSTWIKFQDICEFLMLSIYSFIAAIINLFIAAIINLFIAAIINLFIACHIH